MIRILELQNMEKSKFSHSSISNNNRILYFSNNNEVDEHMHIVGLLPTTFDSLIP
jgi:hypothetical protein